MEKLSLSPRWNKNNANEKNEIKVLRKIIFHLISEKNELR